MPQQQEISSYSRSTDVVNFDLKKGQLPEGLVVNNKIFNFKAYVVDSFKCAITLANLSFIVCVHIGYVVRNYRKLEGLTSGNKSQDKDST